MTQVCVIFGAGEYYAGTPVVPAGAYVIAADGGLDPVSYTQLTLPTTQTV